MVRADLTQLQYEMPEDDEDEEEDGLASPSAAAEGNENEPPSSSGGPEQRKVAILLELLSAGNAALEAKIAQFREEIDLDMLKVQGQEGGDVVDLGMLKVWRAPLLPAVKGGDVMLPRNGLFRVQPCPRLYLPSSRIAGQHLSWA